MLNNSRAMLAINGVLMMALGVAFWFFPYFFTIAMFPEIANNQEAVNVGIALRKNMGVGTAFIGLLLFWCQNSSKSTAQRLLLCCAFGFLVITIALVYFRFSGQAMSPLFIIGFFGILSVLSFFIGSRRFQE